MKRAMVCLSIAFLATGCMKETVKANATSPAGQVVAPSGGAGEPAPDEPRDEPRHDLLHEAEGQPEELGAAEYLRDFDAALAQSQKSGKPVFLLFTEVPGCQTVKSFGNGPLRHPLLVEAIEDEFVPVAIYNNKGGEDRKVLKSFGERAWNNPVVRFVDGDRHELTERYATGWTVGGLAAAMVHALEGADRDVPTYLQTLAYEETARTRSTLLSMYCFWSGEVSLAGLDGVVATRPGFAGGREVVEVTWDVGETSLEKLMRDARKAGAASGAVARTDAEARVAERVFGEVVRDDDFRYSFKDDKYQLRRRAWGRVPMTPAQATRVNRAAVTKGMSPATFLSPRQKALAESDARWDTKRYPDGFRPPVQR